MNGAPTEPRGALLSLLTAVVLTVREALLLLPPPMLAGALTLAALPLPRRAAGLARELALVLREGPPGDRVLLDMIRGTRPDEIRDILWGTIFFKEGTARLSAPPSEETPPASHLLEIVESGAMGTPSMVRARAVITPSDAPWETTLSQEIVGPMALATRLLGPVEEVHVVSPPPASPADAAAAPLRRALVTWKHAAPGRYGLLEILVTREGGLDHIEVTSSAGITWASTNPRDPWGRSPLMVRRGRHLELMPTTPDAAGDHDAQRPAPARPGARPRERLPAPAYHVAQIVEAALTSLATGARATVR